MTENGSSEMLPPMANLSPLAFPIVAVLFASGCCGGEGVSKYQCKSKQAEAMAGLMAAATTMESAKAESGQYPKTMADLEKAGWTSEKKFYSFSITASEPSSFTVEATGTGDMAGDVLRIDQTKKVQPVSDKCSQ